MAIQQVSRITVRKGLSEDLPQPLAGAELGWATDQRRLYIGNGELADGAPVVGNTEILTEFSDLFEYSSAYQYLGEAGGYTVQTGVTSGTPITQSLQRRLDSYAIITDFGAVGDGITDDTAAINRALFQLYCRQNNTSIRRSLFFPAGQYKISDTILIPPYARLYGDGARSSVLQFVVLTWAADTAFGSGVLVNASGSYYRSLQVVPATGIGINNTDYWQVVASLPAYVARTADSRQQTGVNIGQAGATAPTMVSISNLGFSTQVQTAGGHDVFLAEQIDGLTCQETAFLGPLTTSDITADTDTNELAGLRFAGTSSQTPRNVVFDSCMFSGLTYGANTENLVKGVTVKSSSFNTLYQGVVLGGAPSVLGGPTGFRLVGNTFDDVYHEGVIIQDCALNGTAFNTFLGVGNQFNPTPNAVGTSRPVMSISADNNVSVGDVFSRTDADAAEYWPRIYLFDVSTTPQSVPASIAFTNGRTIQLGAYTRQSGLQVEIEDGVTEILFEIDTAAGLANGGPQSFVVDYTMIRDTSSGRAVRTGKLTVVSSDISDSSLPLPLTWNDEYVENSQVDMQLLVQETGGTVTVSVASSGTGLDGLIYYSLQYLA